MALFGITLLLPRLSERMTRPIVALGARLSQTAGDEGKRATFGSSLVLGVATGLLWAPCAGPILGLLLTGAALNGASLGTSFLLLAYAAGAATSLAVALLVGGKVFTAMKQSLRAGEWIRRGLGIAVLAGGRVRWLQQCNTTMHRRRRSREPFIWNAGDSPPRSRNLRPSPYAPGFTIGHWLSMATVLARVSSGCAREARPGTTSSTALQSRPSIFLRCALNRGPIE